MNDQALGWSIAAGFAVGLATLLGWRVVQGRRQPGYFAVAEYWVYVKDPQVPKTEDIMTRMISENPHNRPGRACITNREGMLFTDVRLHIAAALRAKNPHAFRPDLFDDDVQPTAEVLERLAEAKGVMKARYASKAPLKDLRHLQFVPHLADALGDLCGGLAVFDTVCETLSTTEDFKAKLAANNNAERPDLHCRVVWKREEDGWRASTRGLAKIGLVEWQTELMEADREVLTTGLLLNAAFRAIRNPAESAGPFEIKEYGDTFILTPALKAAKGRRTVSIVRRRVA